MESLYAIQYAFASFFSWLSSFNVDGFNFLSIVLSLTALSLILSFVLNRDGGNKDE